MPWAVFGKAGAWQQNNISGVLLDYIICPDAESDDAVGGRQGSPAINSLELAKGRIPGWKYHRIFELTAATAAIAG